MHLVFVVCFCTVPYFSTFFFFAWKLNAVNIALDAILIWLFENRALCVCICVCVRVPAFNGEFFHFTTINKLHVWIDLFISIFSTRYAKYDGCQHISFVTVPVVFPILRIGSLWHISGLLRVRSCLYLYLHYAYVCMRLSLSLFSHYIIWSHANESHTVNRRVLNESALMELIQNSTKKFHRKCHDSKKMPCWE